MATIGGIDPAYMAAAQQRGSASQALYNAIMNGGDVNAALGLGAGAVQSNGRLYEALLNAAAQVSAQGGPTTNMSGFEQAYISPYSHLKNNGTWNAITDYLTNVAGDRNDANYGGIQGRLGGTVGGSNSMLEGLAQGLRTMNNSFSGDAGYQGFIRSDILPRWNTAAAGAAGPQAWNIAAAGLEPLLESGQNVQANFLPAMGNLNTSGQVAAGGILDRLQAFGGNSLTSSGYARSPLATALESLKGINTGLSTGAFLDDGGGGGGGGGSKGGGRGMTSQTDAAMGHAREVRSHYNSIEEYARDIERNKNSLPPAVYNAALKIINYEKSPQYKKAQGKK